MQSQSQGGSRPETPDEVAVSRKVAPASSPVSPGNDADERQSRIAAEAYRIAEECGFPPNSEVDHWYEAQRRLGYAGLDLAASSNGSSSERM